MSAGYPPSAMAGTHENGPSSEGAKSLADFKQMGLLGEGAFSAVYRVQRIVDGQVYALKKVKLPSLSDKEKQNALNEIRLLASVKHENVISYKEAFFDEQTRCLCIITECADGGDLLAQIVKAQKQKTHLNETDLWRYFIGMVFGLQELHNMKILHRDMKCANIFLGVSKGKLIAKLGDFNVSTVAKRGLCMTQTGTPYYASPEVWRDMPYDGKSDIWSLGAVLYEACALHPPFQAKDMEGLYRKVLKGQYPRIPSHFSQELSDTIATMLQVNPRHRPSSSELLMLPAVRKHAVELGMSVQAEMVSDLLNTIKVPRNVIDLSPYLPLPQYDLVKEQPAAEGAASDVPSARSHRESSARRGRKEEGSHREGSVARAARAASRAPKEEPDSARRQDSARREGSVRRAHKEDPDVARREPAAAQRREGSQRRAGSELRRASGEDEDGESRVSPVPEEEQQQQHSARHSSAGGGGDDERPPCDAAAPRRRSSQDRRRSSQERRVGSQPPKLFRQESRGSLVKEAAHREPSASRLPRIMAKDPSRPGVGGKGDASAIPRLPRILSSPNRLPVMAA